MTNDSTLSTEEINGNTKRPRRIKKSIDYPFHHERQQKSSKKKSETIKIQVNGGREPPNPFENGEIVWTKLQGYPWWPALIFGCFSENGTPHTKLVAGRSRGSKRQYFVYFYGPYFEYSWVFTASLLKYSGLDDFIRNAETAVQQATSRLEQEKLANRYQLKVSVQNRPRWDGAIADANRALSLPKEKRMEEFADLLKNILAKANVSPDSSNFIKSEQTDDDTTNKKSAAIKQRSSVSSRTSSLSAKKSATKKPSPNKHSPTSDNVGKVMAKKISNGRLSAGGESKRSNTNHSMTSPTTTTRISKRKLNAKKGDDQCMATSKTAKKVQYTMPNDIDLSSSQHVLTDKISDLSEVRMTSLHAGLPILTKYEEKKIADDLINHSDGELLTLDDAQTLACEQAVEIISENFGYRMPCVQVEWFYEFLL
ncbi:unnamed protein product [Didymodactylos carnosus]|nr:unnamed protein product [Didymodactylos carnosus]CAF3656028.1 unnamed protein product [Didymodactylos carnosus]